MVAELARRGSQLAGRGVAVLCIHAASADARSVRAWAAENDVALPIGVIGADVDDTLETWGVQGLPWLTLADKGHVVRAEGFPLADLDEKLRGIGAGQDKRP